MACVTISPLHSGLLVTGDTFAAKEILKSFGGRWDPEQWGWTLHRVDPEAVKAALRSSKDVARIKDQGPVELQISQDSENLIVRGQTYPIRTLLASEGGVWDAALGGWRFQCTGKGEAAKLAERLQQSGRVGCIIQQQGNQTSPSTKQIVATTPNQCRGKQAGIVDQAAERGSSQKQRCSDVGALVFAGSRQEGVRTHAAAAAAAPMVVLKAAPGAASKNVSCEGCFRPTPLTAAKQQGCEDLQVAPKQGRKIAETTKQEQRLCVSPGGSRTHTTTERRSRRISGKQRPQGNDKSGKLQQDVQSLTVTKRKKIMETKDKVIETATITIKRTRNKKT